MDAKSATLSFCPSNDEQGGIGDIHILGGGWGEAELNEREACLTRKRTKLIGPLRFSLIAYIFIRSNL